MSRMRVSVDTGSVHLPAGEDNLSSAAPRPPQGTDAMSVSRVRHAFDERRGAMPEWPADEVLASPFSLLGRAEAVHHADPAEVGSAIEQLWVSSGAA